MADDEKYVSRFGRACAECGFVRYWSDFSRSSTDPTGFSDVCSDCKHSQSQRWYAQKEQSNGTRR